MTLYRKDKSMSAEMPLTYPDNPDRYQLYFIDDDESIHAPDYDMGARNPDEPIGEFQTLAFVANRNYKGDPQNDGVDPTNPNDGSLMASQMVH